MVKYILLILQKLYFDGEYINIRFQRFAQSRMIFQSGSILFRCDNQSFALFQPGKLLLNELQVFFAEVVMVAEFQQIDIGGVRFHFFHQRGGRGDTRNE